MRLFAGLLVAVSVVGPAVAQVRAQAREETLWSEITALEAPPPRGPDFAADLDRRLARRETLVRQAQLYLSLYPGGRHAGDATRLELRALFEIGCMQGGDLSTLRTRCEEYLRQSAIATAHHEAAYWLIVCDSTLRSASLATQAATQPAASSGHVTADAATLAAYARYVEQFPASRHVPRMSLALFDDARARADVAAMRSIAARLGAAHPEHLATGLLEGKLRLHEAVGKPFPLDTLAGGPDVVEMPVAAPGRVVLVVVWAADDAGLSALAEADAFCAANSGVVAIGFNVDADRDAYQSALASARVNWPQFRHELGLAGPFCRHWGIRRTPMVFVLDRQGRLRGAWGDAGWRAAAQAALAGD